jgi:signal transduction histidine kinase
MMKSQQKLDIIRTLETQGLLVALEHLKKEIAKTNPVLIHLEADKDVEKLFSQAAQETIFSIVAEAMANACKHAQAANLYFRLHQQGMNVIIAVEDDGIGFDVAIVKANYAEAWCHFEERAASVKGKIVIQSARGKGTQITLTIPVDVEQSTVEG